MDHVGGDFVGEVVEDAAVAGVALTNVCRVRMCCEDFYEYVHQDGGEGTWQARLGHILDAFATYKCGRKIDDAYIKESLDVYGIDASYVIRKAAVELLHRVSLVWGVSKADAEKRVGHGRVTERYLKMNKSLAVIHAIIGRAPFFNEYGKLVFLQRAQ